MTVWTIRIALILFAASIAGRILLRDREKVDSVSRALWTTATLVYLAHVFFAFQTVHDWSHVAAVEHTAEQSEQVVGIRFGYGIWFNHLFGLLCVSETIWWWIDAIGYQTRSRWINALIFGYLGFIAINGAIVFVSGPIRWISIAIGLALVLMLSARLLLIRKSSSLIAETDDLKK